jgi:hypothetical protein
MSSTVFALSQTLSLTIAGILELADIVDGFPSKLLSVRKKDLIVLRTPVVDIQSNSVNSSTQEAL